MASRLRVAVIQMFVDVCKTVNLKRADSLVTEAARNGAKMVALPEFFTCIPHPPNILAAKESRPGRTSEALTDMAKKNNIYLLGGTVPITSPDNEAKTTNSCMIYNPSGQFIGQHDKLHLYDVSLGPQLQITESEISDPGKKLTTFDIDSWKIGVGVCMDIRFPEVSYIYNHQKGCHVLVFIGAFSYKKTGPAHWDVMQRARAMENQLYVMTAGPAVDHNCPYVSYGHSAIVNPWGEIITQAKDEEEIIYADLGDIMTGATCGARDAHSSGTPDLTFCFEEVRNYLLLGKYAEGATENKKHAVKKGAKLFIFENGKNFRTKTETNGYGLPPDDQIADVYTSNETN